MLGNELIPSVIMAVANRFGSRAVKRKKVVEVKPDGVKKVKKAAAIGNKKTFTKNPEYDVYTPLEEFNRQKDANKCIMCGLTRHGLPCKIKMATPFQEQAVKLECLTVFCQMNFMRMLLETLN